MHHVIVLTGHLGQRSRLLGLVRYICFGVTVRRVFLLEMIATHNPRGSISINGSASRASDGRTDVTSVPSILSFTRSPTSFINARPRSRSLNSGQVTFCSVEARSFLIYVFSWSESNLLGRGDVAPERGLAGDLTPDNAELAMDERGLANPKARGGELLCTVCSPNPTSVNSWSHSHPSLEASWLPLLFLGNPLRHHHMMLYTHSHLRPLGSK